MKREDCHRYEECSANLCPYDPLKYRRIWYPDEDICVRQGFSARYRWIRAQRKLQKKGCSPDFYFTVAMLNKLFSVHKGTKGINPDSDSPEVEKIQKWLDGRKDYEILAARAKRMGEERAAQGFGGMKSAKGIQTPPAPSS
jgi:hypothetical protein